MQATIEHRKLAVDLAEVVIKWEAQRVREEQEAVEVSSAQDLTSSPQQSGNKAGFIS
jgi:transformation/transcription domain-associated protein